MGSPCSQRASEIAQCGNPNAKLFVPSIGSSTHEKRAVTGIGASVAASSSLKNWSAGNCVASSRKIFSEMATSVAVTRVPSLFHLLSARPNSRCSSAVCARTATLAAAMRASNSDDDIAVQSVLFCAPAQTELPLPAKIGRGLSRSRKAPDHGGAGGVV